MDTSWRTHRTEELQELRVTNPLQLIGMYRQVTGLEVLEPLPAGSSFASVIQTIVDYEAWEHEGTLPIKQSPRFDPARLTLTLNDSTISLIEHLRFLRLALPKEGRNTQAAGQASPIADELFGPIDVCDPSIDWHAAARFANGSPVTTVER